jgi:putative flippase GtrA
MASMPALQHRPTPATRIRAGLRDSANWLQLLRFAIVGGSGYVVNLVVFALTVDGAGHRLAATFAFLVAVTNNFLWNRTWTFRVAGTGRVHHQALRFLVVSLGGFLINLAVLEVLVSGLGLGDLPAQALAVAVAMPANFVGNRMWTFATRPR